MQLQNGLTPSVPYFSQNTATAGANTHLAAQAKADRTSIPTFPIIRKTFGEHNHKYQTVKDNHQQENLSHSQTQRHPWSIPRTRGTQPCQAGEPLHPPTNPTLCCGVTASDLTFGFLCLHVTTGTMKHNSSMLY